MKKEFVIDRQGKSFVLFAGLMDLAHERGLMNISTTALKLEPGLAIFSATVGFADGRLFQATGDATPENVGRNIAPHYVRMGETRAIARALRLALNIGAASLEELGDDDEPPPRAVPRQAPPAVLVQTPVRPPPARPPAELTDTFDEAPLPPMSAAPTNGGSGQPRLVEAAQKTRSPLWAKVVERKDQLERAGVGYDPPDEYAPTGTLADWMNTTALALRAKAPAR